MTTSKINLLLLPLLLAMLLSIATKLRIGKTVDNIFFTVLAPIHLPVSAVRTALDKQISFVKSFPELQKNNLSLKAENSVLLSENEQLKAQIADSKIKAVYQTTYQEILPVRIVGTGGSHTVYSTLSLENVRPGQPLVSGQTLLGTVASIQGSLIEINPLDDNSTQIFPIRTQSGQKGQYKFTANTPQITDIPNTNPITLSENVFSEPSINLPGNLLIGKITKIISAFQEPLQRAEIRLNTTLSDNPENLIIILKP